MENNNEELEVVIEGIDCVIVGLLVLPYLIAYYVFNNVLRKKEKVYEVKKK